MNKTHHHNDRTALLSEVRLSLTQAIAASVFTITLSVGVLTAVVYAEDQPERPTILNQKSLLFVIEEASRLWERTEQPVSLHRILAMDQSLALGQLSPGTRLVLINPHRKLFDELGFVDTGEFLATTLRLPGKDIDAAIVASDIHISEHGYIALTTPGVKSEGVVIAGVRTGPPDAEQKILLDLMSDGLIHYAVGQRELGEVTGVDGKVLAKASPEAESPMARPWQMLINARSAADLQRSVINTSDIRRARQLVVRDGSIRLEAENSIQASLKMQSRPLPEGKTTSGKPLASDADMLSVSSKGNIVAATGNSQLAGLDKKEPKAAGNNRLVAANVSSSHQGLVTDQTSALRKKDKAISRKPSCNSGSNLGSKGKTKTKTSRSVPRGHELVQKTPSQGVLPEWMRYLPKTESLAIP